MLTLNNIDCIEVQVSNTALNNVTLCEVTLGGISLK